MLEDGQWPQNSSSASIWGVYEWGNKGDDEAASSSAKWRRRRVNPDSIAKSGPKESAHGEDSYESFVSDGVKVGRSLVLAFLVVAQNDDAAHRRRRAKREIRNSTRDIKLFCQFLLPQTTSFRVFILLPSHIVAALCFFFFRLEFYACLTNPLSKRNSRHPTAHMNFRATQNETGDPASDAPEKRPRRRRNH